MIPKRRMIKPKIKERKLHPQGPISARRTIRFPSAEVLAKFKSSIKKNKRNTKSQIPFTPI
jgi:hypothetical protein